MFTLLTPSALLALLGILVPVAIHLWNRRPGREVSVGSLRWLAAGANRRLRNLRLEQVGLLLLRGALLGVLSLALAGPVWRQALPAPRGQVLLSPSVLSNPAFATLRPAIDSLRRRGYGLRWLASGFPAVPQTLWRTDSLGPDGNLTSSAPREEPSPWLWARVEQATATFAGQPLYVVTPAALRGFQGSHAPLPAQVTWQTVPTATPTAWVQAASVRGDSLRLRVGNSTESKTTFRTLGVRKPQPGTNVNAGQAGSLRYEPGASDQAYLLPLATGNKQTVDEIGVPVRNQPLRVVLFATPAYAADARALQAALRAAAVGMSVPMQLTRVSAPPAEGPKADWVFWLADAPVPASWNNAVRQGLRLWQQASGSGVADTAHLVPAQAVETPVALYRREKAPSQASNAGVSLWTDGLGRPVLTYQATGRGAIYHLHTRLSSDWSELADSPALPARLLELLEPATVPGTPAQSWESLHDQRALDPAQLAAIALPQATFKKAAVSYRISDLRPWLVLLAGLLFALERLLASRRAASTLFAVS